MESNNPVAPAVAAVPITPSTEVVAGNSVTVNGSNHHGEEEVRSKPAAPMTGYTAASTQQPEPVQAAPQPVKPPKTATPPAAAPAPIEKFEAVSEPVREPEPPVVAPAPEPAPSKRAPEPVAAPKPSVNLFDRFKVQLSVQLTNCLNPYRRHLNQRLLPTYSKILVLITVRQLAYPRLCRLLVQQSPLQHPLLLQLLTRYLKELFVIDPLRLFLKYSLLFLLL